MINISVIKASTKKRKGKGKGRRNNRWRKKQQKKRKNKSVADNETSNSNNNNNDSDFPFKIPKTSFSCKQRAPGYYSDMEANCQVRNNYDTSFDRSIVPCAASRTDSERVIIHTYTRENNKRSCFSVL